MNDFETRLESIIKYRKSDLYQRTEELDKFKEFFSDLEEALIKCFETYPLNQVRLKIVGAVQHHILLYDSKDYLLFDIIEEHFRFNTIEEYGIHVDNLIRLCHDRPDTQVDILLSCIKQHYIGNSYLSVEIKYFPDRRIDKFVSNLVFKLKDNGGL